MSHTTKSIRPVFVRVVEGPTNWAWECEEHNCDARGQSCSEYSAEISAVTHARTHGSQRANVRILPFLNRF